MIHQQDIIGWDQFFLGWLTAFFVETQDTYLRLLDKSQMGLRWTHTLINKLWEVLWDLWEFRNGINNNVITPQHQWDLDEVGDQLWQQQTVGIEGLSQKDVHLINMINCTLIKLLRIQLWWLNTIWMTQAAGMAMAMNQDPQLIVQQTCFWQYFT